MASLPPNVSEADFNKAITAFINIVGSQWVFTSDEDLYAYRDSYSSQWDTEEEVLPSAAVSVASVEEVQEVVKIANLYKIPLFSISTGKNFAYGGPSSNMQACVTLDLKRMDKVIEVNEDRNYALVEPGVTYFDLYRYIQEKDLNVWVDCPDPGWGSPVGNALDHGCGYTMQNFRDHFGAHCGMEVVLPNGRVMRTGMGAMPGADSWQEYKHGFGPDPSGLFGQGNFGIVTKMGFRLMPKPEHYYTGRISVPKRLDLIPLVKVLNYLSDSHLIGEPLFGTPMDALRGNSNFDKVLSKLDGPTDEEFDRFASENNLHAWQVDLQFYGPEKTNMANWEYAKDLCKERIPNAKIYEGKGFNIPVSKEQFLKKGELPYSSNAPYDPAFGVPNLKNWRFMGRTDAAPDGKMTGDTGFYPIIPRKGEEILNFQRVFGKSLWDSFDLSNPDSGIGLVDALSIPVSSFPTAYQMRVFMYTSKVDKEHNARVHRALSEMASVAAEHGWGDYRAAPAYQDYVAETYSFGDHSLRDFHETLKDSIDPNGILSPGRGGIWPAVFRNNRKRL